MRAFILVTCIGAFLAGCSTTQQTAVAGDAQSAIAAAQTAITDYGIAKGIALTAETADPKLAPAIAAGLAVMDGYVAKLQAAVAAAQVDVPAVEALVAQINAQTLGVTQQAAPLIQVVPAAPAPPRD